ncbi:probable BUD13 homolog [Coccomyxa sp. Obi]|nr:probable BUD13 homolog [Coccomyxa sp. Obi]
MFTGLSTLRKHEKKTVEQTAESKKLQEYLQKYTSGGSTEGSEKKKRKKKKGVVPSSIRIVDEDNTGFRTGPVNHITEDDDEDEDAPVIANPGEAALAQRLAAREKAGLAAQGWTSAGANGAAGAPSSSGRHMAADDASPPRMPVRHDSPDTSPPRRRQRHDTPDTSPPRKPAALQKSEDASPPPRAARHDSPDASPPRRRARHDTPDASPPRKPTRHDSEDVSLPRRRGRQESPDASPPRRGAEGGKAKAGEKRMLDGTAAGMISGRELMVEMERKRQAEKERFAKMGAEVTGRHAETVYRDKQSGKRVEGGAAELEALEESRKKPKAETPAWGGGIAQMREREVRTEEMRREAAKPFARTADDVDIDQAYRERVRFGDPMAHLAAKRQRDAPPPPVVPEHMRKLMRKSGFVVPQEVPPHSWLKRRLGAPVNRYGIKPGRHWDGVDRSNGFEANMFKTKNELASRSNEAHMWAQADM